MNDAERCICGHPPHAPGRCPGAVRACPCEHRALDPTPPVREELLRSEPSSSDTGSRTRARARRSDPITSHEAAAAFSVSQLRASQYEIFRLFSLFGACHDEQLLERARQHGVRQSESGIRTRRHELVERGLLKDSGTTVTLPESGRQSIVWMVARQNGQ
jgi:hypothetical protein